MKVSTPGRICLFGEHQDYLMLPVIPAAISLRLTIEASPRSDNLVKLDLPDIGSGESFPIEVENSYTRRDDYFRSGVNVLRRHGFRFDRGVSAVVRSTIPLRAGTSSSSALNVAWIHLLSRLASPPRELLPADLARLAHEAEVIEFDEAGGMMDQYSTALGGVLAIDFVPQVRVEPLTCNPGTFVLGDSLETKDTQRILASVKGRVMDIVRRLEEKSPAFRLGEATVEGMGGFRKGLSEDEFRLLAGTVRNHEITREARMVLSQDPVEAGRIAALLNEHQGILRDVLKISTPKIDRMLDAAMDAGAPGGKINGSGGGGCMFVLAPVEPEMVVEAIERTGGRATIITIDGGSRIG